MKIIWKTYKFVNIDLKLHTDDFNAKIKKIVIWLNIIGSCHAILLKGLSKQFLANFDAHLSVLK